MYPEIHSHSNYGQQHHRPGGGYMNIWDAPRKVPMLKALRWITTHSFRKKQYALPPFQQTDPAFLKTPPDRLRITWIGHSTTLIQLPGYNILTDPIFSRRASPLSFAGPDRKPPLPIGLEDLPEVSIVLISHDHYDHLDKDSITHIQERFDPLFLTPLGVARTIRRWGAHNVLELDWWQFVDTDGIRFHCTPAKHFSGRRLTNRDDTLWVSWFLEVKSERLNIYYAGDSAYASHFEEIREHLGAPDVALIPIGAYLPRWFMEAVHMEPAQAVAAFQALCADYFIPIHWGTFDLADEPLNEPIELLEQYMAYHGLSSRLHPLAIGESFALEGKEVYEKASGGPGNVSPPPLTKDS